MDAPNDMKQPSTPILGDIGPINGGDGVPDPQVENVTSEAWKEVVRKHFPNSVSVVEACLANYFSLLLQDLSNCPALVLIGPSSSSKTTVLDFLDTPVIFATDNFTPRAFVNHSANVEKSKLATEVDLLPRIRHKMMVVKDLSPMFSKRADDVKEGMGAMTRVLDGRGYTSDSGAHGHRGYTGDYVFGFLSATTPLGRNIWEMMSTLGPRLLFLQIDPEIETEAEQLEKLLSDVSYREKVEECRVAVSTYMDHLWERHGGIRGLEWDRQSDDRERMMELVRLANLGSALRGQPARENADPSLDEYNFSPAIVEGPDRYRSMLYNLARGHAISEGRMQLDISDVKMAADVTLSSGTPMRVRLLKSVLLSAEPLNITQLAAATGASEPTVHVAFGQMLKLGLLSVAQDNRLLLAIGHEHEWLKDLYRYQA